MVRTKDGVIYFTPYGEEEMELGLLEDAEVSNGYMSIDGFGFPLEHFKELDEAFKELYPNGKEVEVVEALPTITEEEKAMDLLKYLMKDDKFLKLAGINTRT